MLQRPERALVRSRRVPARLRRRRARRLLLDEGPPGPTRHASPTPRRDLRDRRRPGPPGQRARPRAHRRRARVARRRGIPIGMLYVDAANEAAVGLYRALGFVTHRTDRAYGRDVEAATRRPRRRRTDAATARRGRARRAARRVGRTALPRRQVWDALYRQRIPLDDATALPRALRERLADAFPLALDAVVEQTAHDGMTEQVAVGVPPTARRSRPCSCATRRARRSACRRRPAARWAARSAPPARPASSATSTRARSSSRCCAPRRRRRSGSSNVVFMGMGEPLANYDTTWAAVERLHDDLGLSARHITISTVGVVPGIRRLAHGGPAGHARGLAARARPTRSASTLVPLNRRYPIAEVLDAAAEFARRQGPSGHVRVRLHRRA